MRAFLAAAMLCTLLLPARAEIVRAFCYGNENHQIRTAQGKPYNPWLTTAAHRSLPFGTRLRIRYRAHSVIIQINDRGPYHHQGNRKSAPYDRDLDLSLGACRAIGLSLGQVSMERVF